MRTDAADSVAIKLACSLLQLTLRRTWFATGLGRRHDQASKRDVHFQARAELLCRMFMSVCCSESAQRRRATIGVNHDARILSQRRRSQIVIANHLSERDRQTNKTHFGRHFQIKWHSFCFGLFRTNNKKRKRRKEKKRICISR